VERLRITYNFSQSTFWKRGQHNVFICGQICFLQSIQSPRRFTCVWVEDFKWIEDKLELGNDNYRQNFILKLQCQTAMPKYSLAAGQLQNESSSCWALCTKCNTIPNEPCSPVIYKTNQLLETGQLDQKKCKPVITHEPTIVFPNLLYPQNGHEFIEQNGNSSCLKSLIISFNFLVMQEVFLKWFDNYSKSALTEIKKYIWKKKVEKEILITAF